MLVVLIWLLPWSMKLTCTHAVQHFWTSLATLYPYSLSFSLWERGVWLLNQISNLLYVLFKFSCSCVSCIGMFYTRILLWYCKNEVKSSCTYLFHDTGIRSADGVWRLWPCTKLWKTSMMWVKVKLNSSVVSLWQFWGGLQKMFSTISPPDCRFLQLLSHVWKKLNRIWSISLKKFYFIHLGMTLCVAHVCLCACKKGLGILTCSRVLV